MLTCRFKLLFIIPNFENGGAERNLVRIANNLDRISYDVAILCLSKRGVNLNALKPEILLLDINTPRVYLSIFKILSVIKRYRPNAVFSWMGYLNAYLSFFIPLFPKGIKWFCRESNIPSMVNANLKLSWLFNFFYNFYNRYNNIVCQSQYMATDLVNSFQVSRNRITVINNSVDFDQIERDKYEFAIPSTICSDEMAFNLLYVGSLKAQKRVELLIDVLSLLPLTYSLTILSSSLRCDKIVSSITSHHLMARVTIITGCSNPFPYYLKANCLLLSSRVEGFPNVVLEAFSCGCPSIGFNILGGADEALDNYGGLSLQNKTIDDFAAAIMDVCEKRNYDKSRIIENCRSKYNIDKIIREYESILNPN